MNGDTKETRTLTADLEKWTKEQPRAIVLPPGLSRQHLHPRQSRCLARPRQAHYPVNGGKLIDAAVIAGPSTPRSASSAPSIISSFPAIFGKGRSPATTSKSRSSRSTARQSALHAQCRYHQAIYYYARAQFQTVVAIAPGEKRLGTGVQARSQFRVGRKNQSRAGEGRLERAIRIQLPILSTTRNRALLLNMRA